eukprot:scaffold2848_cov218-Pinguiococcus_pyrenoidosus.AAC.5
MEGSRIDKGPKGSRGQGVKEGNATQSSGMTSNTSGLVATTCYLRHQLRRPKFANVRFGFLE